MYNKFLEYLLDYDVAKTLSHNGTLIRKIISPLLRFAVPITLRTKLKILRKGMILSILVDTFISKISFPMQPGPEIGSISDA